MWGSTSRAGGHKGLPRPYGIKLPLLQKTSLCKILPRPYGIIFKGLLVGMALAGAVIVMDSLNLL